MKIYYFISKNDSECDQHAIEKFSIYRGYKGKNKGHYRFYGGSVERFPKKRDKIKTLEVEFPIE